MEDYERPPPTEQQLKEQRQIKELRELNKGIDRIPAGPGMAEEERRRVARGVTEEVVDHLRMFEKQMNESNAGLGCLGKTFKGYLREAPKAPEYTKPPAGWTFAERKTLLGALYKYFGAMDDDEDHLLNAKDLALGFSRISRAEGRHEHAYAPLIPQLLEQHGSGGGYGKQATLNFEQWIRIHDDNYYGMSHIELIPIIKGQYDKVMSQLPEDWLIFRKDAEEIFANNLHLNPNDPNNTGANLSAMGGHTITSTGRDVHRERVERLK